MDFIKFMISDKRVVVDAKNPDGSRGVVTYPASLAGVKLWQDKLNKDKYYAKTPIPAMNAAGAKIYGGEKFVSYDSWGSMQGAFGADFKKNKDVQAAIDAAAKTLSSLAEKLGYKVQTS
jgi:multiple sugar transport system substrate-binding protein